MIVQNTSCCHSATFKTFLGIAAFLTVGAIALSIIGLTANAPGPFNAVVKLGTTINGALCGGFIFAFILEMVAFGCICKKRNEPIPKQEPPSATVISLKSPEKTPDDFYLVQPFERPKSVIVDSPQTLPLESKISAIAEPKQEKMKAPLPNRTHCPPTHTQLQQMVRTRESFVNKANELIQEGNQFCQKELKLELDVTHYSLIEKTANSCGYIPPPIGMRGGHNFFIFELDEYPGVIFKVQRGGDGKFTNYVEAAQTISQICNQHPKHLNLFKIPKFTILQFNNFQVLAEEKIETCTKGPINWMTGKDPSQSDKAMFKWIYEQTELESYQNVIIYQLVALIYYANLDSFDFSSFIVANDGKIALVNLDSLSPQSDYEKGWDSFYEAFSKIRSSRTLIFNFIDVATHYLNQPEKEVDALVERLKKNKSELPNDTRFKIWDWMHKRAIMHPSQQIDFNADCLFGIDSDQVYLTDIAAFMVQKINKELSTKTHWELISERTICFDSLQIKAFAQELYPNDSKAEEKLWRKLYGALGSLIHPGYAFGYEIKPNEYVTIIC